MTKYDFGELLEAIKAAVVNAHQLVQEQHISVLQDHFYQQNGKTLPYMHQFHVPVAHPTDGQTHELVEVPSASLLPMNSLQISEMKVEFDCGFEDLEASNSQAGPGDSPDSAKRLVVRLGNPQKLQECSAAKVTITFKGNDPPEAVARVQGRLLKTLG